MQTEIRTFETMQYVVRYPKGYTSGQRYPVILALHGAGTRGTDVSVLMDNACFALTEQLEDFPFVMVAPLCHEYTWFDLFEQLRRFAQAMHEAPFTDPDRFYLMGVSMGGYGAWQLAMSLPELFAAMVPICGGGIYAFAARLKNIPIWAFHGGLDKTVKAEESIKMVEAVNKRGGNAKLTIYPENKHDAWTDTYSNPDVFAWLLSHKRQGAEVLSENFEGSKQYG